MATPGEIRTLAGAVYKNYRIERIDPGGLTISYLMTGGGLGVTKITFDQLPPELQQEYGYDSQAAAKYQSGEQQAALQWTARMIADEQIAKIIKAERDKLEDAATNSEVATPEEVAAKEAARKADEEKKIKAAEEAAKKAAETTTVRATNPPVIYTLPQPHLD